ncbi:phosphoesterase [soil metagenome]
MPTKYNDEKILVISRALLDEIGPFQGVTSDTERYLPRILDPANNFFLDREAAEHDPTHKQIIPYCLFLAGDRILTYTRGTSSGESRLHAMLSIGIGGHINASDYSASHLGRETYLNGVEREIAEELVLPAAHTQRIVGVLNDDSTDVGRVHLGVIHLFELDCDPAAVRPNEDSIANLEFRGPADLQAERDRLETWSQLCLDSLPNFARLQ